MEIKGKHNNLYKGYKIGEGTTIGSFCDIGGVIGENCIISSFAFIPLGVLICDNVFIGPRVTFTNDKYPPSYGKHWRAVVVCKGAVIGAGVVILPGVKIGKKAIIGAGSVVTKDVPEGETWFGVPAKKYEK